AFAADAAKGKDLFEQNCTSCHAINEKLIGPALAGVQERRQEAWLIQWIRNSTAMIKAGDPIAVKLFEENNKSVMTSFDNLGDEEIKDILAYIATGGEKAAAPGAEAPNTAVTTPAGAAADDSSSSWMIVVIMLGLFILIVQIFNILKLVSEYTGTKFFNPNRTNANLMIVFLVLGMIGAVWEFAVHGPLTLPEAASEHGKFIDFMFDITLYITGFVFVVTQIALFVFAYQYQYKEGRKAIFYAHNNKLEIYWTVIPAIALTILVLNGFNMWTKITDKAPEDAHEIEVFAYQFGWKARYPGVDQVLGNSNFNLISGTNNLGVAVKSEYTAILAEAKTTLDELTAENEFLSRNDDPTEEEAVEIAENKKKLKRAQGHYNRLLALANNETVFNGAGDDDFIPTEIHVPVDEPVLMRFRARDVIHSAYMPYFRVQMNCVPGMPTQFWFKPTKTTAQIRQEKGDQNFDYYLFCAKICGAAHFNMKIKVVVDSKADYEKWLRANQMKPAFKKEAPVQAETPVETEAVASN
ncbi:MAG: c-type cytochrome, partial [Bacteroidota bacterium]|nr:c-type cytochrome [Bacteroidota bacterium]MDX5430920.1 c-type cytochrome [Bacteroidota bacterium]MDX5469667.1 c-type cytochrome [Bacteroidota bacterium]